MARNYALEGELKEAARAAGALESALQDFELDVQVFRITKAEEIPTWIAKTKTEFKHRYAIQSDHDLALVHKAFVLKNKTAEGDLYKSVSPQRFEELKAQWSNGVPEHAKAQFKDTDHASNPWAATPSNCDMKTGRYNDDAIKRQMSAVRGMGTDNKGGLKAASVAAAVGAVLGQLYAPGFRSPVGNVSIREK